MDFESYISDCGKIAKKLGKPLGFDHGRTLLVGHHKLLQNLVGCVQRTKIYHYGNRCVSRTLLIMQTG